MQNNIIISSDGQLACRECGKFQRHFEIAKYLSKQGILFIRHDNNNGGKENNKSMDNWFFSDEIKHWCLESFLCFFFNYQSFLHWSTVYAQ